MACALDHRAPQGALLSRWVVHDDYVAGREDIADEAARVGQRGRAGAKSID